MLCKYQCRLQIALLIISLCLALTGCLNADGSISIIGGPGFMAIDPIEENIIEVPEGQVDHYHGDLSDHDKDSYEVTPAISGRYSASLSGMGSSARISFDVTDASNTTIAHSFWGGSWGHGNGGGLAFNLKPGQTYTVTAIALEGRGPYQVSIGHQKEYTDVSEATGVIDSMQFFRQVNGYTFTPTETGVHRFELSGMLSGARSKMYVFNQLGQEKSSGVVGNTQGLTLELEAGERYTILLEQNSGYGVYTLNVGHKKPSVDISGKTTIADKMQYGKQYNTYTYTPKFTGDYQFEISGMPSGAKVSMIAFNQFGGRMGSTGAVGNGGKLPLHLKSGETCTIAVQQSTGLVPYHLRIVTRKIIISPF